MEETQELCEAESQTDLAFEVLFRTEEMHLLPVWTSPILSGRWTKRRRKLLGDVEMQNRRTQNRY